MNTPTLSGKFRGPIISVIFSTVAASFSAASVATPELPSQAAKFHDLNISTSAGAAVLYDRILAAAKGACAYYWFKADADESRCVHNAVANAVTKLNRAAVFAVYNKKNQSSLPPTLASQSR